MKTVGIIGGFGPETTAKFYLEVIFSCFQKNKEFKPPILIWNVPLPYDIEKDLILKSKGEERYLPFLLEAAQRLEKGGADFLVLPCNSLHIFITEIRKSVKIPVLSIVEETVKLLKGQQITSVGILGTNTILKRKLYENELHKAGMKQAVPNDCEQAKIGKIINNLVSNKQNDYDRQDLIQIIKSFSKKKVKTVILACTDLQLLVPKLPGIVIFDTMKILVDSTVREILRN